MGGLIDYAPVAATAFAVPQFVPQIIRIRRTDDTAGLSFEWAALTSINNAAWFLYFAESRYFVALVPAACATALAAVIALLVARGRRVSGRASALIAAWIGMLATGYLLARTAGLGYLLTAAFAIQMLPAMRAAYRIDRPTGISTTTWLLILCELACWLVYGIHADDPRLIVLGCTGVAASVVILYRIHPPRRRLRRDVQGA